MEDKKVNMRSVDDDLAKANAKIRELNDQLRDQTAQLTAANRELSAFSDSVSHDLRAPLQHIRSFSRLLRQEGGNLSRLKGEEYLTRIEDAAKKMDQLIEDLLALSHVTRAKISKAQVDLTAMAKKMAQWLKGAAPEREAQWIIADSLMARGDPSLLEIVLHNLMGNAWKYTQKRDRATIQIGSLKGKEDKTIYFVRDDGAGFDPAYADRLFGPFQRLHSESEFSGTGIGLAIVQRIIRRHGGEIWAEGAVEKGATFYFTLG